MCIRAIPERRVARRGGRIAWTRAFHAFAAIGLVILGGCASKPRTAEVERMPPTVMVTLERAGVRDLRGDFRAALCPKLGPKLAADGPACDRVLLQFPGETRAALPAASHRLAQRYRIVFVPGLFAECLDGLVRPFAEVIADLRKQGFDVRYLQVRGRGSVAENAAQLSTAFAELPRDSRPAIVFAYSKGLADTLDMLVHDPKAARQVAAVVAVAGAVNGSPLAEDMENVYRAIGARLPMSGCPTGTGAEIRDLRREARLAWWQRYGNAIDVPLFSMVAVPRAEQVSPALSAAHAKLSDIDPRNDGQLLWYDAVVPGGNLLGYINADHWSVAMDFGSRLPAVAGLFRSDVPRTALVEAAIEVVDRVRASEAGSRRGDAVKRADRTLQYRSSSSSGR